MSKVYEDLPMAVAVALCTERVEFLSRLTDADLKAIPVTLLRDLIEDRRKLRGELTVMMTTIRNAAFAMNAAVRKLDQLSDLLDGTIDHEPQDTEGDE